MIYFAFYLLNIIKKLYFKKKDSIKNVVLKKAAVGICLKSRFLGNNIYLRSHKVRALANNKNQDSFVFNNYNYILSICTFLKRNTFYIGLPIMRSVLGLTIGHITFTFLNKSIKKLFYTNIILFINII